jgi:Phosphotransferase enzyme family
VTLSAVAALLLPPDAGDGAVVRADGDWRPPAGAPAGARGLVWGREPTAAAARPALARYAWRRERAVRGLRRRPPAGLTVAGVHRWTSRFHRPRLAAAAVWRLREGVVVELARRGGGGEPRVLDEAAAAAGVARGVGTLHIGITGAIVARVVLAAGRPAVLRAGRSGSPADPAHAAAALERLAPLGLECVPEPVGGGSAGPATWATESQLPGTRPRRLSPELVTAVARFCALLPRGVGPPASFGEDLDALATWLPAFEPALDEVRDRAAPVLARLPAVLGHGDLWAANLLVADGRLRGVVDWDGWHPSSVPGVDLLHLVGIARAFAGHGTIGEVVREQPWRDPLLARAAASYWAALEVEPSPEVLEVVALAWWAARLHRELSRAPDDARHAAWLRRHVVPVLGEPAG